MTDKIAYGAPPVAGPFTVVWDGIDAKPGAGWQRHEAVVETEHEAVGLWKSTYLYENLRGVSITPEPHWARYSYDGRTPLTR